MISLKLSVIIIFVGIVLFLIAVIYSLYNPNEINVIPLGYDGDNNNSGIINAKITVDCENKALSLDEQKILADIVINFEQIINGTYVFPKKLHPNFDAIKNDISLNNNSINEVSTDDSDFVDLES